MTPFEDYDYPDFRVNPDERTVELRRSALSSFVNCPRQFYWTYFKGLSRKWPKGQIPWSTADTGIAFHAGMAGFHENENPDEAVPAAMAHIDERFPGQDLSKERRLVTIMLEGFLDDTWDEPLGGTFAAEIPFGIEHHTDNGWTFFLHGHIDRLYVDSGRNFIEDYKTCANFSPIEQHLPQMMLYALMASDDFDIAGYTITQVKRVLRTKVGPFYKRETYPISEDMLTEHRELLKMHLWRLGALLNAPFHDAFWPNPTERCAWQCSVKPICDTQLRAEDPSLLIDLEYTPRSERTTA